VKNEVLNKIELPFFLTSANISDEKELYNSDEIKEIFVDFLEDVAIID